MKIKKHKAKKALSKQTHTQIKTQSTNTPKQYIQQNKPKTNKSYKHKTNKKTKKKQQTTSNKLISK